MTRARAPGKVVLSGAYSVLHGAPAIVTAVARYVTADSSRPAEFVTPEVQAALRAGERAPSFDASKLREAGRKLGLGSSAAILVASLYALERDAAPASSDAQLRRRVFPRALAAHRAAQGGGSGVDVAASCHGGTLSYALTGSAPHIEVLALPAGLVVEIWCCPESSSTRQLIGAVNALAERDRLMSAQAAAAERALAAAAAGDARSLITALSAQHRALVELGRAAGVPIVTGELRELQPAAEAEEGTLIPAGAGGGDIALFVGPRPSTPALREALQRRAHHLLPADLSAPGVAAA